MSKSNSSNLFIEEKIKDFSELLDQIDNVNDKKKKLWKEIYENAVTDRQNAYVLFTTLVDIVENKSTEHAIHGRTLATYIEKMSKANDQIIRLAELVAKSEQKNSEEIDPEEMFKKIGS
jgi:single-stranded DNA-specific DHH superfamily exonuclease